MLVVWTEVSNASISARTATDSLAIFVRVEPFPIGNLVLSVVRPAPDDFRRVNIADEMAAALPAKNNLFFSSKNSNFLFQKKNFFRQIC